MMGLMMESMMVNDGSEMVASMFTCHSFNFITESEALTVIIGAVALNGSLT